MTTARPVTTAGDDGDTTTGGTGFDDDVFDGPVCGGCYGRPYVANDLVRVAPVIATRGWVADEPGPRLDDLSTAQREALSEFWADAGQSEHSSVAGFHRFTLDLLAHGAPASLVARAQQAAVEELEHARSCFALASAYAGRSLGPGPMPLGRSAPVAATLEELALWTAREGCIGETLAAWLAEEICTHATDPVVRRVMAKIAEEETRHAELAWATIRWARDAGGATVHAALVEAFASPRIEAPRHGLVPHVDHGLMPSSAIEAAIELAYTEVVRPCARDLLAA